jgi:hypothetical protein
MNKIKLEEGTGTHKWKITIDGKVIRFGARGYTDYTLGATKKQKENYIKRHESKEDWSENGIYTAGFWSRWLLWNKPTITDSIKDIERRFLK